MTDEQPERRPMNRENPQTEYEDVPRYYHNHDVPHVLARLRFMERFFNEVVDEDAVARDRYIDLYGQCMDLLEKELQPYALPLALSLIALEDEITPGPADVVEPEA
jgi:hypothetical protein